MKLFFLNLSLTLQETISPTEISFDKTEVQPGDEVNIKLSGPPSSTFYILGVDKGILLLDKGNDVTEVRLELNSSVAF